MDANRFDLIVSAFSTPGTRRGLPRIVLALPLLGSLFTRLLQDDEADARRRRRHDRSLNAEKKRKKKKKKRCKPEPLATTCAGACGTVRNSCKRPVDCGSCDCEPTCPVCRICDAETRTCRPDPGQVGDSCGDGKVCRADGECACSGISCGGCIANEECIAAALGNLCCAGACVSGVCCEAANCGPQSNGCVDNQCVCGGGEPCADLTPDCCGEAGACVSTADHRDHCGSCGHACAPYERCVGGQCQCDVCLDGSCAFISIQDAIDEHVDEDGDTIAICPGLYLEKISVNKSLTLLGAGSGTDPEVASILDAAESGRVVFINVGVTATLRGWRITGGKDSDHGAGIYNQGVSLTLDGCTVSGNTATGAGDGGGIYNNGGTVTLIDVEMSGNTPNNCAPPGSVDDCID